MDVVLACRFPAQRHGRLRCVRWTIEIDQRPSSCIDLTVSLGKQIPMQSWESSHSRIMT